ncbi:MAG: choice-of-anchor Q domain-containing protein [Acidobacteriota bacterium]
MSCSAVEEEGVLVAAPDLEPLAQDGGWSESHSLANGSAGIDIAPAGSCGEFRDQVGELRVLDGDADGVARCDAGTREHVFSPEIYSDGFESEDTSAWSSTIPGR